MPYPGFRILDPGRCFATRGRVEAGNTDDGGFHSVEPPGSEIPGDRRLDPAIAIAELRRPEPDSGVAAGIRSSDMGLQTVGLPVGPDIRGIPSAVIAAEPVITAEIRADGTGAPEDVAAELHDRVRMLDVARIPMDPRPRTVGDVAGSDPSSASGGAETDTVTGCCCLFESPSCSGSGPSGWVLAVSRHCRACTTGSHWAMPSPSEARPAHGTHFPLNSLIRLRYRCAHGALSRSRSSTASRSGRSAATSPSARSRPCPKASPPASSGPERAAANDA